MIISAPQNKYEQEVFSCLLDDKYSDLSEGTKSIVYDLSLDVHKHFGFNWEDIDISNYVWDVYLAYKKSPNIPGINVIANCINKCFPTKHAYVESKGYSQDGPKLIIEDRRITNVQIQRDN